MVRALWRSAVPTVTAHEVKSRHLQDRNIDRGLRWSVKKKVPHDGMVSNLFAFNVTANKMVHRYDMEVVRQKLKTDAPGARNNKIIGPVSPNRIWKVFTQFIRKNPLVPPIVRVGDHVWSAEALPEQALNLPSDYHDAGWEKCRLVPSGKTEICRLSEQEMKMLMNRLIPWSLEHHARDDQSFSVVRDTDGKMVCAEDAMAVAGLRIFRGTTAAVMYVQGADAAEVPNEDLTTTQPAAAIPAHNEADAKCAAGNMSAYGDALSKLSIGVIQVPFVVLCVEEIRSFTHNNRNVQVYMVEDSSGKMAITCWNFPKDTMVVGSAYSVCGLRVKKSSPQFQRGSFQYEAEGTFEVCVIKMVDAPTGGAAAASVAAGGGALAVPPVKKERIMEGDGQRTLVLRLDTRCTVASEKSLWEEVKQHFGEPPYAEDRQRRIIRAVQGTPVIMSHSLRHTSMRHVRFDVASPLDASLDPLLIARAEEIERGQPYAVLLDYSLVPLQVLHCCYDPKMRSWQDVTVPACSFLPKRRKEVLERFRAALNNGLQQWGCGLSRDPWVTKMVSIMNEPQKQRQSTIKIAAVPTSPQPARPQSTPTKTVFICVNPDTSTREDAEKRSKTSKVLARSMRSQHVGEVTDENAALQYLEKTLMPEGKLTDKDCAAVFIVPDKATKASRWLYGEALKRGVLPVLSHGASSDKRIRLLAENTRLQIQNRFQTDPMRSINVGKEVPVLEGKNVLIIGVDACHHKDVTVTAVVGLLVTPQGNHVLPCFWLNNVRGKETESVAEHFGDIFERAVRRAPGNAVHECVVFQDGNVFSELESMKSKIPPTTPLSFMCLHKRTHIRFFHQDGTKVANVPKGSLVNALTPMKVNHDSPYPSFYLQNHDCFMSTARTVQYTVHELGGTLSVADLQRLSFVLSHVGSPMSTKLPLPTRCAHRLSAQAEVIMNSCPDFKSSLIIPEPLNTRVWFL